MTLLFVRLMLVAALGAAASPAAGEKKMERDGKAVPFDDSFELRVPAGWTLERRAGGAVLTGPEAEGVSVLISVRHIRPDDVLYGTPEAYMKRLTKPSSIPIKGWKNGEVKKIGAAGRKALDLERDTSEFVPPHAVDPKEVAVREEHLAVPATKGFYLLVYTAPRSIDAAQRPVFRRLVEKGFTPKL